MPAFVTREELLDMTGWEAPPSEWFEIDQSRIDAFADATEDHQFIHVDPDRAAETPLGGTIAHGFLTLSLVPRLLEEVSPVLERTEMAVNYGLDKVRFLQPVRAGSRVRARMKIAGVREKDRGRILVKKRIEVEIEGEERPALIAETLVLFLTRGAEASSTDGPANERP